MAGKILEAKEKSIEQAKDIPYLLSNIKKYLNKLFIKAKGVLTISRLLWG